MKKIYSYFSVICFLFMVILMGCGTADPVSNSAGPSTPSNIVLNLEANPQSTNSGGTVIITVTATFFGTGVPAAGFTVTAVSSAGGTLSAASAITDSNGQAVFTYTITEAATATFTIEDLAVSIRINVNG